MKKIILMSYLVCFIPFISAHAYVEKQSSCKHACMKNEIAINSTQVSGCINSCKSCLEVNRTSGEYAKYQEWGCPKANYSAKKKRCSSKGRSETVPASPYEGCKAYKVK